MTADQYIYYPALSASRIKRHYTGDLTRVYKALEEGQTFHKRLLETHPKFMDAEAYCVYKAIIANKAWEAIWNESQKEVPQVKLLSIRGQVVPAKAKFDIKHPNFIADIKTTSCRTQAEFAQDMLRHYNHIQANWFSMVAGYDPSRFVYIGVSPQARRGIVKPEGIFFHTHTREELTQGLILIEEYIDTQWKDTQKYLNLRSGVL